MMHPALNRASDAQVRIFRALVEMTRANNGRGARESCPDAFTPSSIIRRTGLSAFNHKTTWHNLCVTRGLIEDAQHQGVTLYRLTKKGREVGDAAFPVKTEAAS